MVAGAGWVSGIWFTLSAQDDKSLPLELQSCTKINIALCGNNVGLGKVNTVHM